MPRMSGALCAVSLWLVSGVIPTILAGANIPSKIYGVNLGSWLLLEPWMLPRKWVDMGGERCDDCSDCIASEFAFAQAYPDTVDQIFDEHWSTWFSQDDVDKIVSYGLNTVRVPLGYWIVEPLVNRSSEFFPRGGMKHLKRGLRQLKEAGISAVLDHHALPGVSTANQMFAGRCTSDVQFYTEYNYHRALIWTAVMTALSHLDADFGSVFSIEAINEPIMDASKTPGFGDFQKNFVRVVRAVECLLGIRDFDNKMPTGFLDNIVSKTGNVTQSFLGSEAYGDEVGKVLFDAAPMLAQIVFENGLGSVLDGSGLPSRAPLATMQSDVNWQWNNPPNPADAAIGPQIYDNHLYYAWGWVADANEEAYLNHSCNLQRVEADAAKGNSPLIFGEWSLATQWTPTVTDEFLMKWADVQKRAYSKDLGWIFWSFKIENSDLSGDSSRYWSYFEGIDRGYFTKDPTQLHDPHICDPYISTANNTANSTSDNTSNDTANTVNITSSITANVTARSVDAYVPLAMARHRRSRGHQH